MILQYCFMSTTVHPRWIASFARRPSWSNHAAKAEMAGRRIHRLGVARGWAITAAIIRRAEVRAAFDYLARNFYVGLARVIARVFATAARILRHAARLRRIGFVLLRIPVGGPLPDVADHVVHTVAIGRERRDGGGALISVRSKILVRKCALPGIRHLPATGRELLAP